MTNAQHRSLSTIPAREAASAPLGWNDHASPVSRLGSTILPITVACMALLALVPFGMASLVSAMAAGFGAIVLIGLFSLGITDTAIALVGLAFIMAPLNDVRPIPALSFVTASDLLFVLAFFLLVPMLIGKPFHPPAPFVIGASGVIMVGAVAAVASDAPGLSLNNLVRLVVGAFGLPVLFMLWDPSRRIIVGLAGAFIFGNVVNVVAAVLMGPTGDRYRGLSTHVNILGLCAMLGLALIPFLLAVGKPEFRWLLALAALICSYGIWISGSRAALLVAIAVAALYPLMARSLKAAIAVTAAGVIVLAFVGRLAAGAEGDNALSRLLGGGSAEGSDEQRKQAMDVAIAQFRAHPIIGDGFGTILQAHNIYLEIAAAVGMIGLAFYLILIYSVIQPAFVVPRPHNLLAFPAVAYAMYGMIQPLLWDRYIWCVLAFAFVAVKLQSPAETDTPRHASTERAVTT